MIFLRFRKNSMNRIRIPIFESRKLILNHNLTFASVFSSFERFEIKLVILFPIFISKQSRNLYSSSVSLPKFCEHHTLLSSMCTSSL
ncbi:hypothetical protein AR158_c284R [Paramecium bursaria Chlorella virus AR158]|uniref:hypothetical protein n=1 Tax=Paramecium bursaria Chlorella virus AR158 TaxID=380598 RepID=UPI00015AA8EB|nr:hypothetical protein AR158_c284R [Paramecium bursaria Chlorella virus AR158]ABU43829.1 hypothetical protein AR158_c284R [Paramecium bursaria Chlorella virus AR158]